MNKLEITYKNIDEIIPYENNPRKNDEAVQYVANSIKEFGFKVPIIIDKDGVIVAGHTRYKAANELGLKEVPVILADDLTEDQIKAFRIADNKVGEKAGWDLDKLKLELDDINLDIDMTEFGFGDFEISMLTEDMDPEGYDDDLINAYSENADDYLARKRVIITYTAEQEDFIKKLVNEDKELKVVYTADEILEKQGNE